MEQPKLRRREPSPYSKWERRGSAFAHASGLLIGVPLIALQFPPLFAFLPNPVVAYLIARTFRRKRMAWGAFQGIQASVVHLILLVLLFVPVLTLEIAPLMAAVLFTAAAILFIYTLWGAWDTLLGYDFRYIGIGKFLDRVSQANLDRAERRRGLIPPHRTERDDKPQSQ